MRMLLGWIAKLSIAALAYARVVNGFDLKLPDTVLGYKVPDSVKSAGKIREMGVDTSATFKKIGDSISR